LPAASGRYSTFVELLRYRSLQQMDKLAFSFLAEGEREVSRLTYGELDRRARALARKLQQSCPKGERAILLDPPGLDFIVGFLGCLYAGIVAVPAYLPRPNRSLSRLQAILSDAHVSIALTTISIL